ncbi:hypothetical protein Tco_1311135 [Tanacetum coccineum]
METKMKSVTKDHVKPTILAPGKYAIDVEPIPPRNRNNREVHLDYLRHLKESVETLHEIVEEAKELLEYAIDTCPKDFNKRDKKQVTFEEQCDTSNSNTHIHVGKLNTQQTNVPVPPSTGVNCCTNANGSQPRSNTKKNTISPAKGTNKKKVEEHPRTNKSNLRTTNRVDSSSSSKRTVINSNSDFVCQTCNKCLIYANHDMCVVDYLQSVKAPPSIHNSHNVVHKVKQVWKPKQVRQVWKPTGKVLTSVGYQWRPTGRIFTLGEQCPLTRLIAPKVAVQIVLWYLDSGCSKHMTEDRSRLRNFMKKFFGTVRFRNDHFGAIMGYGDYMIGDSVISRHDLTFFRVFGALCYPINDSEDLGKLQPTVDIGIFVGYAPSRKGPAPSFLTPGLISSGFVPNLVPADPYVPPINKELEILFQPMFNEYLEPPRVERPVSPAPAVSAPVNLAGTPSSTTIDQDAPSPSHSPSSSTLQSPSLHQGVTADSTLMEDNPFAPVDNHPFINVFAPEPSSEASSSRDLSSAESPYVSQTLHHLGK